MAKLPNKIQDIVDKKQAYIDKNRSKLESSVIKMQEELLKSVIENIIPELETKDGQILNTAKNLKLIEKLDSLYTDFNKTIQTGVVKDLGESLVSLNKFNNNYFGELTLNEVTQKRFDQVSAKTNNLISTRIGITPKGKVNNGGFLDSFITDRTLLTDLKQTVIQNVTGQQSMVDFKKVLKDKIVGNDQVSGGFEKYYRTYAYDVYQEYDRAYGKQMADEFGMDYALYQGGLINDSRDFCRDHENHVYTREEVGNFGKWTYAKAEHITTFNDPGKQEGVPSYIEKFPNYDPATNCGGFNCRHQLSWITKSAAIRLRPDLAENATPKESKQEQIVTPPNIAKEKVKTIRQKQATIKKIETQDSIKINYKSFNAKDAQKYYDKNQSDMSDFDDYKTIADYKFRGYEGMNAGLRGGDKKKLKEYSKQIDTLSKYIDKNKITDDLVLHRKVRVNFFKDLKPGDVINDTGFSSASLKKDFDKKGFFGNNTIEIRCPKGSKVASLNESNLLEFCIDKNAKYRVIENKGNGIIIELLK
jgi:hypothetical protein